MVICVAKNNELNLLMLHIWLARVFHVAIDNTHHYGFESNKHHLNQASFVPPTKFINVTGFAKTVPNGTRIEIPFIAWHES